MFKNSFKKYRTLILILGISCVAAITLILVFLHTTETVYRTAWGFFPSEISVPIGTEVRFVNLSDTLMWPASDIHPNHNIYTDFDPRRGVKPDDSWSFTFDRRGQWVFHDHLSTHFTGLIKVYDETGESSFECTGGDDKRACWASTIDYTLRNEGVAEAFDAITGIHQNNPEFATACHNYTHDIGLKTYIIYGTDFELTGKTSYCNAGFFHGFMEGLISNVDDVERAEEYCLLVKEEIGNDFPIAEEQCRHGIGHGILEHFIITRPDLLSSPPDLINEAIAVCEATNESYDHLMRCVSGAFNVYRDFVVLNDDYQEYAERENLYDVCSVSTEKYAKEGCYWELSKILADTDEIKQMLTEIEETGTSDMFALDALFPREDRDEYLPFATRSWAFIVGKFTVNEFDADTIVKVCSSVVPTEAKQLCIRGISEGAFSSAEPYEEHQVLDRLCSSNELNTEGRNICYDQLQEDLKMTYNLNVRDPFCEIIPQEYKKEGVCLQ